MDASQLVSDEKTVGFLDLPGEIRNQIYGLLLPDEVETGFIIDSLRSDGTEASTSFMATNRQVYEEAADILYGDRDFRLFVERDGSVDFLGRGILCDDVGHFNFSVLNEIKKLHIEISSDKGVHVCNVQDTLFKVFEHLHAEHKLHELHVSIHIDGDQDAGYALFTSNYAERMYSVDVMREFRHVAPGDLSRGHLAAFLTDPLRSIRHLKKHGKKQPKFTLDFTGKNGRPWRDIRGDVFTLIKGSSPVPDYQVFSPYYDALRTLLKFARNRKLPTPPLQALARELIRGNVTAFRGHHQRLLSGFCQEMRTKLKSEHGAAAFRKNAERKEHDMRELEYLIEDLCVKLPAVDADLSFYGYNLADEALAEWQNHGREEEKAAKAKRKQERQKRKREEAEEEPKKRPKS